MCQIATCFTCVISFNAHNNPTRQMLCRWGNRGFDEINNSFRIPVASNRSSAANVQRPHLEALGVCVSAAIRVMNVVVASPSFPILGCRKDMSFPSYRDLVHFYFPASAGTAPGGSVSLESPPGSQFLRVTCMGSHLLESGERWWFHYKGRSLSPSRLARIIDEI